MTDTTDQSTDKSAHDKEETVLMAVKKAITLVVKDTATAPGLKHPLSDETIIYLRDCLGLISAREQELAKLTGRDLSQKPHYIDEARPQNNVIVSFDKDKPGK